MNRRISSASLLYAETGPARWLRIAATIGDAGDSGLFARRWHAGRPLIGRSVGQPVIGQPAMGQPVMGQPVMGQPVMGQPASVSVRVERTGARLR